LERTFKEIKDLNNKLKNKKKIWEVFRLANIIIKKK